MPATKIMVIRHGEKPSDDGSIQGVSLAGKVDPEALSVRGWQRAGALVRLFAPLLNGFVDRRLAKPRAIFASGLAKHSKSLRPQQTVAELAAVLALSPVLDFPKGDEAALVAKATATDGVVLIAWEHEAIPDIANRILGNGTTSPQRWPGSRFDLVWVFDQGGPRLAGAPAKSLKCCCRATALSQSELPRGTCLMG
jgi:broad specificity phosphatase PhoE